ncbi:MAG: hypothetical protein IPK26_00010 [Planctomycetes bacterium]|nr:hypothetical protein [Planctomycetota bacterium]
MLRHRQGTARRIGDRAWQFVAVRGGDLLFLGDQRRDDNRLQQPLVGGWAVTARPRYVWGRSRCATTTRRQVTTGEAPEIW